MKKVVLLTAFLFGVLFLFIVSHDSFAATGSLSPTSQDFGTAVIGSSSSTQTFTLSRTGGSGNLTVTSVTSSSSTFVKITDNCTGIALSGAETCTVDVKFFPTAIGVVNATLTFVTNAVDGTNKIATMTGAGVNGPTLSVSPVSPFDFGSVTIQSSSTQDFTITNSGGSGNLTVTAATVAGGAFSKVADGCINVPLAPLASCIMTVQFFPTAVSTTVGILTITSNAANGTSQVVSLMGTGVTGVTVTGSISPTSNNYGTVSIGSSVTQDFQVTNTGGTGSLTITSVTSPAAPFLKVSDNCLGNTLATMGDFCTITVAYNPTAAVTSNSSLTVVTNATNGTNKIASLTGTGMSGGSASTTASITPSSFSYGTIAIGSSSSATFTLTNTGASTLTITSASVSAPATGISPSFFISSDACSGTSLMAGAACTINVDFSPTTDGSFSATLTVVTNAGDGTNKIAFLSGSTPGSSNSNMNGGSCALVQPVSSQKESFLAIFLGLGGVFLLLRSRVRKILLK